MNAKGALTATVLLAVAAGSATAEAAAPAKGARITGTTSQGQAVSGRVTSDGKFLQMSFAETFKCTDGTRIKLRTRYINQKPAIKADGRRLHEGLPGRPRPVGVPWQARSAPAHHGRFLRDRPDVQGPIDGEPRQAGRTCRSSLTLRLTARG